MTTSGFLDATIRKMARTRSSQHNGKRQRPTRRRDYGIRIVAWVKALPDLELKEAVLRLCGERQFADRVGVDAKVLARIDVPAQAAVDAVRNGTLVGPRAVRKLQAFERRLDRASSAACRAREAAKVQCPTCGTRVDPSSLKRSA
jgi:hypothetical protein